MYQLWYCMRRLIHDHEYPFVVIVMPEYNMPQNPVQTLNLKPKSFRHQGALSSEDFLVQDSYT